MKKIKFSKKAAALAVASVILVGGAGAGTLAWLTADSDIVTNTFKDSDIEVTLEETTGNDYKMVPGWVIDKDPVVTVEANSEDCYVFLKVTKTVKAEDGSTNTAENAPTFDDYIYYAIDTGWKQLKDDSVTQNEISGVYYRTAIDVSTKKEYSVLAGGSKTDDMLTPSQSADDEEVNWKENQVLTRPSVTKDMMESADTYKPTLSFEAYAVQLWKTNKPVSSNYTNDDDYNSAVKAAQFTPYEAWCKVASSSSGTSGN